MAWFNPKTWARGAGVPSDELNTYLRDNTLHLYQRLGPWRDGDGRVTDEDVRKALGVDNEWSRAKDAAAARTALGLRGQRELRPLASRSVQGSVLGSITPVGLCSFGDTIWVASGSSLIPIDTTDSSVGSTISLSLTPNGIATNGSFFWIAQNGFRLIAYDSSGSRVAAQDAGARITYDGAAFGGGNLYAIRTAVGGSGIERVVPGSTSADVRVSRQTIIDAVPNAPSSFSARAFATDGEIAWIGTNLQDSNDKLFAFSLRTGAYDPLNDVTVAVPPDVMGATVSTNGDLFVIGTEEKYGVQAYRFIQVVVIDG